MIYIYATLVKSKNAEKNQSLSAIMQIMDFANFFAERLKSARLTKGYTLGRLSELCGIHEKALFKYERGLVLPTAENLKKLALALDISSDYFLFDHAKMEGIPKVKDSSLYDRYLFLENLSEIDRKAALLLLDSLIARQKLKELTSAMEFQ